MKIFYKLLSNPIVSGIIFFVVLFVVELISILLLNNGTFIYTLDDPYIHLALSKNIMQGHYGINSGEYSAPSSSIIWPFLLAPFSSFNFFEFVPLIINLIFALVTIYFYHKIILLCFNIYSSTDSINNRFYTFILISLILITNLLGLVFTGMEHSLQVLFIVFILYNVIKITLDIPINFAILSFSIILSVLIRYENVPLSLFVLIFYLTKKKYFWAIFTLLTSVFCLMGFSLFLKSMELGYFPSSVIQKSGASNSGLIDMIISGLTKSYKSPIGFKMLLGVFLLIVPLFNNLTVKLRLFIFIIVTAVIGHIVAGSYNMYNRYEIYIWTALIISLIFIYSDFILKIYFTYKNRISVLIFLAIILEVIIALPYFRGVITIPIASNNIYLQQYQMHRFVKYYYFEPIAVGDLGLTSFKTPQYKLDFVGLGSYQVIKYQILYAENWMEKLAKKHEVKLIMIYEDYFNNIPNNWIKLGELQTSTRPINLGGTAVSFYIRDNKDLENVLAKLKSFASTLPKKTKFVFSN
ncbi:MAG TPA: hypothetical protein PL041_09370 [Melioribacteraceae bacterium]|nr:hypothetical protein [Melioribacteraceae bacterium]